MNRYRGYVLEKQDDVMEARETSTVLDLEPFLRRRAAPRAGWRRFGRGPEQPAPRRKTAPNIRLADEDGPFDRIRLGDEIAD